MLIILIVWIYATFLLWSFGLAYQRIIEKVFSEQKDISPYLTLWNGILFITVILSVISIFSKITYELSFVFLLCSILYIIFDFSYVKDKFKSIIQRLKGISPFVYVVFLVFIIITLHQSLPSLLQGDAVGYHQPAVKWINNYSVVPGLGNLHNRLAYNPHWFLFSALLNYNDYNFHFISGLIMLFAIFWGLTGLNKLFQKRFNITNIIKALSLLPMLLLFSNPNVNHAFSTDLATFFIVYFILYYAVKLLVEKKKDNKVLIFMLVNFSFFVLTIKLSSLFIVIAPLYFLYLFLKRSDIKLKSISFVAVSFIIIIMPFLIRNIILSGYLVFPFPMLDFFNFDWKMPYNAVVDLKNFIGLWAKWQGGGYLEVANNDFWFWFIPWIKVNWKTRELLLLVISIITYVFYFFFHYNRAISHLKKFSIIYLTLLVNISVWFITAPAIRFASGYIFFFSIFLIALQEWDFIIKIRENVNTIRLAKVLLILALCVLFFRMDFTKFINIKDWITLSSYPEAELTTKKTIDNTIIYVPVKDEICYNSPLTCTAYFNPNLEMRGKSLQDGFRIADNK